MLIRWNMTERGSGNQGLLQVQYAFLEEPKLRPGKPTSGAELWAWLFVHGRELTEIPSELPKGPHRAAVELANQATFSLLEMEAYRKVMDEIQQARDYGETKRAEGRKSGLMEGLAEGHKSGLAEGHKSGLAEGLIKGKRDSLLRLVERAGIQLSTAERERIQACDDVVQLDKWTENIFGAQKSEDVFGQ